MSRKEETVDLWTDGDDADGDSSVSNDDGNQKPAAASSTTNLVLEDDDPVMDTETKSILQQYRRKRLRSPSSLFCDETFPTLPSSIRGIKHNKNNHEIPKCRCKGGRQAKLAYKTDNNARPYFCCSKADQQQKCKFFAWAFREESMQWFRFGSHSNHRLVAPHGYSANDLCQGKVGDCWFLSALAVVAQRPDLIQRLLRQSSQPNNDDSIVQVQLFLDGYWKTVVVDNFLPCFVDPDSESMLQQAIRASLGEDASANTSVKLSLDASASASASEFDPNAIASACHQTLSTTKEFLEQHQRSHLGRILPATYRALEPLQRPVTSQDLAYSKAHFHQLWVPFIEKAYAKSHGSYSAISGGHIAEAFLDLTGAPTLVFPLLQSADFDPRAFWYKLVKYKHQQLPMGCGTDSSAVGIIGHHAYSILDVREVSNVSWQFFQETEVAHGNVSGFTDYDGKVRLLKIRNPHGQGEWKGDFSDRSQIWEKLLQHGTNHGVLERSMKDDGTFWIDYDNFLMAFSNVDVVLAFLGNHAKSIPCNFPLKSSNHRCCTAFELLLLDNQPGLPNRDSLEVYVMGIQKTKRGASSGRKDRKVSYKVSDFGILVGESDIGLDISNVSGQMFGFRRNGHFRMVLDRTKHRRMLVMPISFGHPAATDDARSYALRFVSDAPLLIRQLPDFPRMDGVLQRFCLQNLSSNTKRQILTQEDGLFRLVQVDCTSNLGCVVFLYLCVNEAALVERNQTLSVSVEVNCRGMSCRVEQTILKHETVSKGKKFEAAWRRYTAKFESERESRLLMVVYQSGQDSEFGSIQCEVTHTCAGAKQLLQTKLDNRAGKDESTASTYKERGIFHPPRNGVNAYAVSQALANSSSIFDHELEHALELSRRAQSNHVITSDGIPGKAVDRDLERALEISKLGHGQVDGIARPPGGNETTIDLTATVQHDSNDRNLARAIQLSLEGSSPRKRPQQMIVDLTNIAETPSPADMRRRRKKS